MNFSESKNLGLDSQFALMETVTTAILDAFPPLRNYKFWVVLAAAVLGYVDANSGNVKENVISGRHVLVTIDGQIRS